MENPDEPIVKEANKPAYSEYEGIIRQYGRYSMMKKVFKNSMP
jgi:hypothetical protein